MLGRAQSRAGQATLSAGENTGVCVGKRVVPRTEEIWGTGRQEAGGVVGREEAGEKKAWGDCRQPWPWAKSSARSQEAGTLPQRNGCC